MPYATEVYHLAADVALKRLEEPSLYNRATDELYELNDEAAGFLERCAAGGASAGDGGEADFVAYCLAEGILAPGPGPVRRFPPQPAPRPSLRYLEVQLTDRCNLRCRHCYLGEPAGRELPRESALRIPAELAEMHGLRLILSGGEPLLYRHFWELNERLPEYDLRAVLLTNGTAITRRTAERLRVHEVQVSLDGLREAHEYLRGPGTFRRVMRAVEALREAGIAVSLATMVYRGNAGDLEELARLAEEWEVTAWNVDVPAPVGRLAAEPWLCLAPEEAAPLLDFAFGGGLHAGAPDYACGVHLATVDPDGGLARCGFYSPPPGVTVQEGLRQAWAAIPHQRLADLSCACAFRQDCRGGCRFRAELAGDALGPDPVQCLRYGLQPRAACGGERG